jgi:hypothetical protein
LPRRGLNKSAQGNALGKRVLFAISALKGRHNNWQMRDPFCEQWPDVVSDSMNDKLGAEIVE